MNICDLISEEPPRITPLTTLEQASSLMCRHNVRTLPVCDNERLVGIVTAWDIVSRGIAEGRDSWFSRVADIMTTEVESCDVDCGVEQARALMSRKNLTVLPVVGKNGELHGMLTREDLGGEFGRTVARLHVVPSTAA